MALRLAPDEDVVVERVGHRHPVAQRRAQLRALPGGQLGEAHRRADGGIRDQRRLAAGAAERDQSGAGQRAAAVQKLSVSSSASTESTCAIPLRRRNASQAAASPASEAVWRDGRPPAACRTRPGLERDHGRSSLPERARPAASHAAQSVERLDDAGRARRRARRREQRRGQSDRPSLRLVADRHDGCDRQAAMLHGHVERDATTGSGWRRRARRGQPARRRAGRARAARRRHS